MADRIDASWLYPRVRKLAKHMGIPYSEDASQPGLFLDAERRRYRVSERYQGNSGICYERQPFGGKRYTAAELLDVLQFAVDAFDLAEFRMIERNK